MIKKLEFGGAEMQLMSVARAQKHNGHEIIIITLQQAEQTFVNDMNQAGIPVHSHQFDSPLSLPKTIIQIHRLLSRFAPDVVHSHMFHSNIVARILFPFLRKPIFICTAHNTKEGGKLRDSLYRLTDGLCDVTTNVSKAAVHRYNQDGLVRNNGCLLIENGIDQIRFIRNEEQRHQYRQEFKVEDKFVWLSVASLTRQKDFPNMLRAYKKLTKSRQATHLFIAGDGPEREAVIQLIDQLELNNDVTLLGNRKDTVNLYSMADGFVMSSAWEGLPIVLLEALSCSLPCVATDVGGNKDLVINGTNGYVVPAGSDSHLAKAMADLMTLPNSDYTTLARQGRQHIQANYGIDSIAKRWINLYLTTIRNQQSVGLRP